MCTEGCSCGCEPRSVTQILGQKGDNGLNGWSPLLVVATDGERRVHQIIGWTGGTGNQPAFTNQYLGETEIVENIEDAADIRGAQGDTGDTGDAGDNGWTAVLANVTDGERIVQQIVDWVGGDGTKPSVIDQFVGPAGIVNTAGAATNIRGAEGAQGDTGENGADVTDGRSKISSDDTTLGYLQDKLVSSDGTVSLVETNPAGNETLEASTKSLVDDQYEAAFSEVGTSYADVLTYTTPNDGFTRKYKVDYGCVGYIAEIDGFARTSVVNIALYIDGSLIKEKVFPVFSKSGYSRSEHDFTIQYVGAILPNKIVAIKVKRSSESPAPNTVRLTYKSLSIFGIL
jgi:hypothetical protein